jgi:hypothetical protein
MGPAKLVTLGRAVDETQSPLEVVGEILLDKFNVDINDYDENLVDLRQMGVYSTVDKCIHMFTARFMKSIAIVAEPYEFYQALPWEEIVEDVKSNNKWKYSMNTTIIVPKLHERRAFQKHGG